MSIKNTRRRRRTSYSPTRRKGTSIRRRRSYSPTRRKRRSSPLVIPSSWASSVDRLPQSNRGYRGKIKKEWPKPVTVTPKNIASLFTFYQDFNGYHYHNIETLIKEGIAAVEANPTPNTSNVDITKDDVNEN